MLFKNSIFREVDLQCHFVANTFPKPILKVKSSAFGGAKEVKFELLNQKQLDSLKDQQPLPMPSVFADALTRIGSQWIPFLQENKFVEAKECLVNFILDDILSELENIKSPLTSSQETELKQCVQRNVNNLTEEKIKPNFFEAVNMGPKSSALTHENFYKLAVCLMYSPQQVLQTAFKRCFEQKQTYRLNENDFPKSFLIWLGIENKDNQEPMEIVCSTSAQ